MSIPFSHAGLLARLELAFSDANVNLAKSVTSDGIAVAVPQSLEDVAHNTLWDQNSPNELTLLKSLPSTKATKVIHETARITSYGLGKGSGFFAESGLPSVNTPTLDKLSTYLKLQGIEVDTTMLAELQQTVSVMGTNSPAAAHAVMALNVMLRQKQRNIVYSDDSKVRGGTASLRIKGIIQQIREGTDGTYGVGVDGVSHVIDMRGLPLNLLNIRNAVAGGIRKFGSINSLYMDASVRQDFESSLDGAARLEIPTGSAPIKMGQLVAGVQTNGQMVRFLTDNTLSPDWCRPFYSDTLEIGAPTSLGPASGSVATTTDANSRFDSNPVGAGDYFWVVTEVIGEREGAGRRIPGSGYTTVAVGYKATLSLTPSASNVESFRIYRGSATTGSGGGLTTDAQLIDEVAVPSGASVSYVDRNYNRNGLGTALGLRLISPAMTALASPNVADYEAAWQRRASFTNMADGPQNTVTAVHLGPQSMVMDLAKLGFTAQRQLVASVYGVLVRNPLQNYVFTNVGRRS
jgi:hypothetical protein